MHPGCMPDGDDSLAIEQPLSGEALLAAWERGAARAAAGAGADHAARRLPGA